ncbi:hypothetical protein [Leptospira biflexa]|uniref:hypothetical protein n=1 Tax=Leptospira biflexa TaxID=172 RepID=UPI00108247AA|nr:hypothetical protein [Leptospira biflexa]TGM31768.1 hypothetical protein EHQ89_15525 [Leptospira biflexa]TGM36910.1 hypothetical protein EHQ80_04730 [Leptospira biflexa]
MLKNLYILSENSWGIKSSEIFADFFYFITLIGFFGYSIAFVSPLPILSIIISATFTLLYLGFCIRMKQSPYWLGLISQLLLVLLILPTIWLSPLLLSFAFIFAYLSHYFLIQNYSLRFPIFCLVILFLFLFDSTFSLMGYQFRSDYSLVSMTGVPLESSVLPMTLPWMTLDSTNTTGFISIAESLGVFLLVSVAWVSFRRTILISFFISWVVLYKIWGIGAGLNGFSWNLSYAALAFFLQLAPGRNFYGSFYVTIISFVILLPIAFFVGKMGISAIWVVIVFFLLESLFVRVFLGK